MKIFGITAVAAVLFVVSGCSTPQKAKVRWEQPGKAPRVRAVEFEEYNLIESEGRTQVYLKHTEKFAPWEMKRHYMGESLMFSFAPVSPEGPTARVSEASYQLNAYVFFDSTLIEGTVAPVPDDPASPGEFRLVFANSNFGEYISTITISGRLQR
jgi:hypothetical protein